jgi:DNA-directed RNA polymerase subunit RPC12/RpoP
MEYTPFKCPDCSVWWRSETHKCDIPNVTVTVNPPATAEKKDKYWEIKTDWHKNYLCLTCKEPLSKLELVEQHTRCTNCRIKRNKGHRKYGHESPDGNA